MPNLFWLGIILTERRKYGSWRINETSSRK